MKWGREDLSAVQGGHFEGVWDEKMKHDQRADEEEMKQVVTQLLTTHLTSNYLSLLTSVVFLNYPTPRTTRPL